MNAVEIEQAFSELAEQPFDREEFPFQFLAAFGNKETTLKRLRTGVSNKSDVGLPSGRQHPRRHLRTRANPCDPSQSPRQCGFHPSESAVLPCD